MSELRCDCEFCAADRARAVLGTLAYALALVLALAGLWALLDWVST